MVESIKFHNWMIENDTQENAEKYCGFSDEDMYHVFKEQTNEQTINQMQ
jgi:hypothetical protein